MGRGERHRVDDMTSVFFFDGPSKRPFRDYSFVWLFFWRGEGGFLSNFKLIAT